jgi:hypothetical protein
MIDEKIARVKNLIAQREAIDAELSAIFGMTDTPKRGRPRKESAGNNENTPSHEPGSEALGAGS